MSESQTMEPSLVQPEAPAAESRPVRLRQAREAACLHIAALAAALKVPVKKLEALEAGRYEDLPDLTFARALASSACRHLKIDPAPVLEQIPVARAPQLGDAVPAINAAFRYSQDPAPRNPVGWLSRPAVLGAIALLLATLVLVFMPSMETAQPSGAPLPPVASGGGTPEPNPEASAAPTEPGAPVPTAPGALVAAVADSASEPTPSAAAPLSADPVAAAGTGAAATTQSTASGSVLNITATDESWVQVRDATGSVVTRRLLNTGDVIDFSSAPPYTVVLGRADAVRVSVRGQAFDVTPYASGSVARFEVK